MPTSRPEAGPKPGNSRAATDRSRMRRELIEARVFEVAARLFASKGYGGTALQDIASELGVSRTALYHYVPSKEELLRRVVLDLSGAGHQVIREEIALGGTAAEQLTRVITRMTELVGSNPARFRLLLQSEAALPPEIAEVHVAARRKVLSTLVELIENGQRTGEFRPVDARSAALAMIGMWNWVAFWIRPTNSPSDVASVFAEIIGGGLVATHDRPRDPSEVLGAAQRELDTLARMLA